jgi:hypothetical protein
MNFCEKYSGSIEDLIEGELDEQKAGRVESHVFECPKCRKQYETLQREKEIYAHYLFDAEPPKDLWTNFEARLAEEKEKASNFAADISTTDSRRGINILGFWRLSPALASLALLLFVCLGGLIWHKIAPVEKGGERYIAENQSSNSHQTPTKSAEIERRSAVNSTERRFDNANETATKNNEPRAGNQSLKAGNVLPPAGRKTFAAETVKIEQKAAFAKEKKTPAIKTRLDEIEQSRFLQMKNLETEIAGQVERVEMLLRSFRNARAIENSVTFDVEYERAQARKLLEKNAGLRRDAENYGILYAEELLSRVEPLLLDIANLEAAPAPDKVRDIKERVGNQNIIASLQVY